LRITLLHDLPVLLPELAEALGRAALRSLTERGVDVRLNAKAVCVGERGVLLAGGSMLDSANVVCTVGTQPNALAERLQVVLERGRIPVHPDLSVRGTAHTWAVGDCALVHNAHDDRFAPPTAQFAVREARLLAENLLARLSGKPTRAFRYRPRGSMAAIGHRRGVAEIFGIRLWGFPAWLLWRAYYLAQMPIAGRKLRIFVEWTWAMLFRTDITHLRFHRSADVAETGTVDTATAAEHPPRMVA